MGLAANNHYIGEAPKFMDQRVLQSGIDITNFGPKPVAFPIRNKKNWNDVGSTFQEISNLSSLILDDFEVP